jgi:hypothetical protein
MKKIIIIFVLGVSCVVLSIVASGREKSPFPACFNKPFVVLNADQIEKNRREEASFHMTIEEVNALVALNKKSKRENDIQNPYNNHTPTLRFNRQGELERIPSSDKK